jgi:hypothetical protein
MYASIATHSMMYLLLYPIHSSYFPAKTTSNISRQNCTAKTGLRRGRGVLRILPRNPPSDCGPVLRQISALSSQLATDLSAGGT